MAKMKAPDISRWIDRLKHVEYRQYGNTFTYNQETYDIIEQIFAVLERLSPANEYGTRELWLSAERGTIEDYGDYENWIDEGAVENYQEFEKAWHEEFPEETCWYQLHAYKDPEDGYCCIHVNHKFVLEVDPRKDRNANYDISEFAGWVLCAVKNSIAAIKEGTYYDQIDQNVPPRLRTGTILLNDYWTIFPDQKESYFAKITPAEMTEFIEAASKQGNPFSDDFSLRQQSFTANEFFRCCALGYAENHYEGADLSPLEQYRKHADGRDDGLTEIDPDSPGAFADWHKRRHSKGGGHPWEVCRGGNSTHVSCAVCHDESGYFIYVAGSALGRTIETVKFYLAIRRAGYPVYIEDAEELVARFKGTERIGIVPETVFPRYCHSMFPGERVIAFMHLPFEKTEEVVRHCVWQPLLHPVLLESEEDSI